MIYNIKETILEDSALMQNVRNMLTQGSNNLQNTGKQINQQTQLSIKKIQDQNNAQVSEDKYNLKPKQSFEEALGVQSFKKMFNNRGAIDPTSISKGKNIQDINDVTQSGSSQAAGLKPGSRAKIEKNEIQEGTSIPLKAKKLMGTLEKDKVDDGPLKNTANMEGKSHFEEYKGPTSHFKPGHVYLRNEHEMRLDTDPNNT